jgi:hypothetical protein
MIKTFEQFVSENLNASNELNIKRLNPYISKIIETVKTIMDELTAAETGGGGTISEDINLGGKMHTIAVNYDVDNEYFELVFGVESAFKFKIDDMTIWEFMSLDGATVTGYDLNDDYEKTFMIYYDKHLER